MRSQERHRDVAAYALGVLDEADAFRFEDHLMECARCAAHVTEFGPITRQMMLFRRSERANRVIDFDQEGSMEIKKREGYF